MAATDAEADVRAAALALDAARECAGPAVQPSLEDVFIARLAGAE